MAEKTISDPIVVEKTVAFRTNIGDARVMGFEAYAELDWWQVFSKKGNSDWHIGTFVNFAWLHGEYVEGQSSFLEIKWS